MKKRVVITGIGTINPIGNTVDETWESIKNGVCGVNKISYFDTTEFRTSLAAELKKYEPTNYFEPKAAKRLEKVSQLAIIAAREAIKDSGINEENTDFNRVGTYISSGIGGFETIQKNCETNKEKGPHFVSPMLIPMAIANMPAGNVAIDLGLKGESMSIVTACASSTHAIGEAYKSIKHGYEDVIVVGGTEASICEVGIAGFENMKALSFETDPKKASTPFDKNRNGFVMGEGAGILVLEELGHALNRGAHIYAEVAGFGSTTDAYHITSPDPSGEGASKCMIRALKDAKMKKEEIDYINAHGTSTPLNDKTETKAIKLAFKKHAKNLMVSSTKGNTGHLLGAAGAVEAILCTKAIQDGIVPPSINYSEQDPECDLNVVPNKIVKKELNAVMSNSLGFGGHNASIILKQYK